MKGDAKMIVHLNKILANELIAINQYFLHSRMLKNWGFKTLADKEYAESIDEMKHADLLMERILFLEGSPNLNLGKLNIGTNVREMLAHDLAIENTGHHDLKDAIQYAEQVKDYGSRDLLKNILTSEEEHIDWLETQLSVLEKIGIENYLQSNL